GTCFTRPRPLKRRRRRRPVTRAHDERWTRSRGAALEKTLPGDQRPGAATHRRLGAGGGGCVLRHPPRRDIEPGGRVGRGQDDRGQDGAAAREALGRQPAVPWQARASVWAGGAEGVPLERAGGLSAAVGFHGPADAAGNHNRRTTGGQYPADQTRDRTTRTGTPWT